MPILTAITQRVVDIVCNGRGVGSPVSQVNNIAIPSGNFRLVNKTASLEDETLKSGEVDRAIDLRWLSVVNSPKEPGNNIDAFSARTFRLQLRNAVVFGCDASHEFVLAKDGEVKADVYQEMYATARVLDHSEQIALALCHHAIHGNDTTPAIVRITRSGEVSTRTLFGKRIIATQLFDVVVNRSQNTRYV